MYLLMLEDVYYTDLVSVKWEMIDSFSRFVSLPRKTLTSLSIRFDSSQRTNPMLAVLEELEYDKLEHFQLEVAYLMEEEAGILCTLEKFLTRHTNIESIRLAYIELHGREWRDILEILIQYPNLKVLELENLTQEDESVSFDGAKQICLRHNSDMPQAIISAMHQLDTQGGNDMDIEPTHRYYKYTDDSEPDYDEE